MRSMIRRRFAMFLIIAITHRTTSMMTPLHMKIFAKNPLLRPARKGLPRERVHGPRVKTALRSGLIRAHPEIIQLHSAMAPLPNAVNLKQLNEGLSHTVEQAQQYTDERFATVQNAMNHVQAELNQIGKAAYA